jgi:hypothetical protein
VAIHVSGSSLESKRGLLRHFIPRNDGGGDLSLRSFHQNLTLVDIIMPPNASKASEQPI